MKRELDRSSLGDRLREARMYRGFSQEEVAEFVGVPRSSISQIENGQRGIDTLELQKISELFECSIDELVNEVPAPATDSRGIALVARAAARLSASDRQEVLRFARFLQSRRRRKSDEKP
jgi:transcriptional regulator with XRE-family HTH domain